MVFLGLVLLLRWQSFGLKPQHGLVPVAFLTGGFLSGLAGFIGMNTATRASSRTAQAAKESLNRGLQVAFRAGAVMGLVVVGLGLLHISLWSWLLAWLLPRRFEGFAIANTVRPLRTDALDSLGNTTAATGKGFAIGSAALTGLAEACERLGQREEAEFYRHRAGRLRNEG